MAASFTSPTLPEIKASVFMRCFHINNTSGVQEILTDCVISFPNAQNRPPGDVHNVC
jgi:hypothetical protein